MTDLQEIWNGAWKITKPAGEARGEPPPGFRSSPSPLPPELPKPPVPYTTGWRFTAESHSAPNPTLVTRGCCKNSESDKIERKQLSPVERCLKRPPLPGGKGNDSIRLEVIKLLKGGDGHNSQVFTVRLIAPAASQSLPQEGTELVANIYDPLYFGDDEGLLNPFLCMDKYYTHEANAYKALGELHNCGIPKYYGSYSLDLLVDSTRKRTVRMILIEHVRGMTMADAEPEWFSQNARQHIMKTIVDLESRIYEKDIWLVDLEPRNIIIRSVVD
ncbi:uncharacterized protein BO97DRAFT_409887 [Aspergillus homomorphus CBS 101889]|uniref:Protein kinase domain-containing protein n=1 Tax=Aspergillus homomorphus (strain CBS 101889) TaxID=1450537 RepID=A0A395IE76_ASPHC|nr:hypothetical protein BO97DRAFT_409887 [Aspergillus homomorphus CBS 101889]RAL17458.1 hypothetical protein BO97DRAFT_409887 [Aspergillus homomorphus CBS 101889]